MTRKIITLALIVFTLFSCRSNSILINVTFDQLSGLEKGDRVLYQGNAAGHVNSVQLNPDGGYSVQLEIDKGFANAATEYSRFHLVDDAGQQGRKGIDIQLDRTDGKLLASGSTVAGVSLKKDLAGIIQEELEAGMGFLIKQIEKFSRDVQGIPESEEYQKLRKTLEALAAELENKEQETREKLKNEWLPKVQRELDALRERLRQMGREDDVAPLDQEVERLRRL